MSWQLPNERANRLWLELHSLHNNTDQWDVLLMLFVPLLLIAGAYAQSKTVPDAAM